MEILTGQTEATPLHEVYGYDPAWGFPSEVDQKEIARLMRETAPGDHRGESSPEPRGTSTVGTG